MNGTDADSGMQTKEAHCDACGNPEIEQTLIIASKEGNYRARVCVKCSIALKSPLTGRAKTSRLLEKVREIPGRKIEDAGSPSIFITRIEPTGQGLWGETGQGLWGETGQSTAQDLVDQGILTPARLQPNPPDNQAHGGNETTRLKAEKEEK